MRSLTIILAFVGMCSCSSEKDDATYENYGDIYIENNNSFIITQDNHKVGWGVPQCFMCHNINNIHQIDLVESLNIDLKKLQEEVRNGKKCSECHGPMGVKSKN